MTLEINIAHARLGFKTIKYIVICLFEPQQSVGDILFLKLSIAFILILFYLTNFYVCCRYCNIRG
jgi:hypothetical protein